MGEGLKAFNLHILHEIRINSTIIPATDQLKVISILHSFEHLLHLKYNENGIYANQL